MRNGKREQYSVDALVDAHYTVYTIHVFVYTTIHMPPAVYRMLYNMIRAGESPIKVASVKWQTEVFITRIEFPLLWPNEYLR